MPVVFVTGGSGFLGTRVVQRLDASGYTTILLDRPRATHANSPPGGSADVQTVEADLLEPAKYAAALARADVVLHLAALTGRASEAEHFRVNARGTESLVEECRRAGVTRMLFVSSIAAKFPEQRWYPYARAKVRAEAAVRDSGLRFTIVRPTMILGPGSRVLAGFEKLAGLPVMPIFGDGLVRVQPIYVDDLADLIVDIVVRDRFDGETLELGGPAALTIEDLIRRIRRARGGAAGLSVHIPLGLVLPLLRTTEVAGLSRFLPVSAGQLSSFRYDGTIESNSMYESRRASLRDVDQMLALSLAA